MSTTTSREAAGAYGTNGASYYEGRRGDGWIVFGASMLGLGGVWAIIEGILAISNSKIFIADTRFIFSGLNTWGWIVLILGVVTTLAALAIVNGSEWARWFGIAVAGINAIGQLAFFPAYPWWAAAMFTIDVLVIYSLAAYGGKQLRT